MFDSDSDTTHIPYSPQRCQELEQQVCALQRQLQTAQAELQESRRILQSYVLASLRRDGGLLPSALNTKMSLEEFLHLEAGAMPHPSAADNDWSTETNTWVQDVAIPAAATDSHSPSLAKEINPEDSDEVTSTSVQEAPPDPNASHSAASDETESEAEPAKPIFIEEFFAKLDAENASIGDDSPLLDSPFLGQFCDEHIHQSCRDYLMDCFDNPQFALTNSDNISENKRRQLSALLTSPETLGDIWKSSSAKSISKDTLSNEHPERVKIWDGFAKWLQELTDPGINFFNKETDDYSNDNSIQEATRLVHEDSEFSQTVNQLNKSIFQIPKLRIWGQGNTEVMSHTASDGSNNLFLHPEWCSLALPTKKCLIAWQMCAIIRNNYPLTRTLDAYLQDKHPSDLGAILLKRALSDLVRNSIVLPSELLMEASGLWGGETVEELNDLLAKLYEATEYSHFQYIRELIDTPHPMRQVFNLEADALGLQLSNIGSATEAIVVQICGLEQAKLFRTCGLSEVLQAPQAEKQYLHQRLTDLWCIYCSQDN